jgi:OCT family organic cation transporter-like MFS transporter 4/5
MTMETNEALSLLGSYGRWQVTFFVILSIANTFPSCWHVVNYVYEAYTPAHHCKVPTGAALNETIPWDEAEDAYSSCYVYVNDSLYNHTVRCADHVNDWDYNRDVSRTIVTEWNLVCDREYMKRLTSTLNGVGIVVGSLIFPSLIDQFGRRHLLLFSLWLSVAIGIWNALASDYYQYITARFLAGFVRPGYNTAAYVLMCELFPATRRTFPGIMCQNFWALAIMIQAVLMYLITDWRHLTLLLSLLGLLSIPLYW